MPIISGRSDVSLRLIDYFITNYAKKHKTSIVRTSDDGSVINMNVFATYRSQLKSYSKSHFDPFRRRDRLRFHYTKDDYIDTTIGQLNLFRWILTNDILNYIVSHREAIEFDMVQSQRESNQRKQQQLNQQTSPAKQRRARVHDTTGIVKTISSMNVSGTGNKMVLQFD